MKKLLRIQSQAMTANFSDTGKTLPRNKENTIMLVINSCCLKLGALALGLTGNRSLCPHGGRATSSQSIGSRQGLWELTGPCSHVEL